MDLSPGLRYDHSGPAFGSQGKEFGDKAASLFFESPALYDATEPIQAIKGLRIPSTLSFRYRRAVFLDSLALGLVFSQFWILTANLDEPGGSQPGVFLNRPEGIGRLHGA